MRNFKPHKAHRNIGVHIETYVFPSIVCYVTMWFHYRFINMGCY